jgi:hypothetical protein
MKQKKSIANQKLRHCVTRNRRKTQVRYTSLSHVKMQCESREKRHGTKTKRYTDQAAKFQKLAIEEPKGWWDLIRQGLEGNRCSDNQAVLPHFGTEIE